MFTECEKWRKEHGVDDLYKNFKYTVRTRVFKRVMRGSDAYILDIGKSQSEQMYVYECNNNALYMLIGICI